MSGLTGGPPPDAEAAALLATLACQRASVLAIVDGLGEDEWHTPVVPSGWTVAGMVEHLGDAEGHWFQGVMAGSHLALPWDEGRPPYSATAAFVCARPAADVLGYYRDQCARSDAIIAGAPLGRVAAGRHDPDDQTEVTLRDVILHVIEETAAHTGHLDIARELLDGRTNLGLR